MKMNKVSRPDKKNNVEFCVRVERRTHVNSKENQNRPVWFLQTFIQLY